VREGLREVVRESEGEVVRLREEVKAVLEELERHYFGSVCAIGGGDEEAGEEGLGKAV
jgi:hypothetical protein